MPSVAVVGAGLTGLAAASRLSACGAAVSLFEAAERVGGVVRSERHEGYLIELGPSSMARPTPAVSALLTAAGLDADRLPTAPEARQRYIVRGGRLVPLPLSPPALLASPLLSAGAKLGLMREPFTAPSPPDAEESVADFVRRRLGTEVLDYVADPFVAGVYAGDPEQLMVRHALPAIYALEQQHGSLLKGALAHIGRAAGGDHAIWSYRHGLQQIPDALAARLRGTVHLGAPVVAIMRDGSRWILRYRSGGKESSATFDAVVFAAPAHALGVIALDPALAPLRALASVPHPPVAVLSLGFRRADVRHPLDGFGMLVPSVERLGILGAVFSSTLFPGRAPEGHLLLTVFIGGAREPTAAGSDTDALTARAMAPLRTLLGLRAEPVFRRSMVWPAAIPQFVRGYGRVRAALDEAEAAAPGFVAAGTYRDGVAVGDALKSGVAAAERVLAGRAPASAAPDGAAAR